MAKDVRLKIYPAVIGVLGICLVALFLSRLEIKVERVPLQGTSSETAQSPAAGPQATGSQPAVSPNLDSPNIDTTPTSTPKLRPPASSGPAPIGASGHLRVSNQTDYPVRVALLPQQTGAKTSGRSASYSQPVHWDFAPDEGSEKGLIMSLPDGELKLRAGDVLVAFAEDGSRRYWGPFVVGKTDQPVWNKTTTEWLLILQP